MEYLRDDYLAYMTGERPEPPMFAELFGPLVGLEDEWRAQGASEDEVSLHAFGFDYMHIHHLRAYAGMRNDRSPQVIEETPDYAIAIDEYGRTTKLCKGSATIGLPLSYPVTDMASWEAVKPWYTFRKERFDAEWLQEARKARAEGALIIATIPGGYDEMRQLMGEEEACVAYYEQPELVEEMLRTFTDTALQVLDRVTREIPIDILFVHEDFAGKSGPLVGPLQLGEHIGPYYRTCWELAASRGATLFQMDTDGNVNSIIPHLVDAGINCLYPMEPAAGMDIVEVRKQYGKRLAMLGGIDKHVLRQSPAAIRQELEYKMQPCMREGGIVFGLDHRIPNGTPLEHYRYYVRTARDLLGLAPNPAPSWGRAAM